MNTNLRVLFLLIFSCSILFSYGQRGNSKVDAEKMKAFQEQSKSLIQYFEETINFLGDSTTLPKDRQVVINDSYVKIFRDNEVQIEDDLISDRITVFYKPVQAYLRDINFFYRNVHFTYHVQTVEPFYNANNALCFKVTANRSLKGTNIKGESFENNMVRYIEIEYNEDREDLKIVSIYTTQLEFTDDLAIWWKSLSPFWKNFFSKETVLQGNIKMSDVVTFSDTTISFAMNESLLNSIKEGNVYFKGANGQDSAKYELPQPKKPVKGKKPAPAPKPDTLITILYPGKILQPLVSKVIKQNELNLDNIHEDFDLAPLEKMTNLSIISMNNTNISNLNGLRNINKLNTLEIAGSKVSDLSPISFLINLKNIDLSGSMVTDISTLSNFVSLNSLNISNTKIQNLKPVSALAALEKLHMDTMSITDLSVLEKLKTLKILTFNKTNIADLSPLQNLSELNDLSFNQTKVTDLSPLKNLKKLEAISFENTPVNNLTPLNNQPELKHIQCNNIVAQQPDILAFIKQNPHALVVFNTKEMETWWNLLEPYWQDYFSVRIGFFKNPTPDNLAAITAINTIDISSRKTVTDISCFDKILMLKYLNASLSGISSLVSLSGLTYLEKLNITYTSVNDISPLQSSPRLDTILANNTKIKNISTLKKTPSLKLIECDNSSVMDEDVESFRSIYPQCLVVYKTEKNQQWWDGLSEEWKKTFFTGTPDKYQIQGILNATTVSIKDKRSITSIAPLESFRYLKRLEISGSMVSLLAPITKVKTITYLNIANTPVVDIDLLSDMKQLDSLNIENTQVKKYEVVGELINLIYLDISGTQIKNLKPLASLLKLEELGCSNTAISSLDAIIDLPNLKKIKAFRTKMSEKSVDAFKKKNPNCEIIFY